MCKFKKIKLEHEYHDSRIISFSYSNDSDIEFEISLDGCWNNKCVETRHLIFHGIRNFNEVRQILETAKIKKKMIGFFDEIIGIGKIESKYVIDLSSLGSLIINAKSISET
jgi:hypothetical protein